MPKRIVISKLGGPEVLTYEDYSVPSALKPDHVRIKQSSVGLNYIDVYHRSGLYPLPEDPPVCPGLEASGEVVEVGNKANGFSIGDRVCYAGGPLGAYCEIRDFPVSRLIKLPEGISEDVAASMLLRGMTVEYLFERLYKIKKDEHILFHAAAGGLGLIASQWAKSVGCKMIGTVGSDEKILLAKNSGCEHIINYKTENVIERVKEITEGKGVSVVYDGVGKDTFDVSLQSLGFRGLFVSFGQSSGMPPEVNLHKTFNPKSLYYTRPTLMHYTRTRKELEGSSELLFSKIRNNEIKEHIVAKIDLNNAADAHELLQSRQATGSIVLKP
jgi:NADPH2:quinone reductase